MRSLLKDDELTTEMKDDILHIENQIENKQIPESYPEYLVNDWNSYSKRTKFIKQIGFSLVSLNWIEPLSKWIGTRKCLEVMAGTGVISYALQQQGINIIATDDFSWKSHEDWEGNNRLWTTIENIDAIKAVEKYGRETNVIIMSWPYMDDIALKVLQKMREVNPSCVMIYIGEGCGGCTADDEFYNTMEEIEDDEFEIVVNNYQRWWGLHDYPQLIK